MSTTYQFFLQRSGLNDQQAADLHHVAVEQVKAWATPRINVPGSAVNVIYTYCRTNHPPYRKTKAGRPPKVQSANG